jgi:Na+/melibiose symporter-like transporter
VLLANASAAKRELWKTPVFWYYGSAAVAFGIKNNAFSYLLLIYANQVLGIPGYLAAWALGIAIIWDAVSDLILGHWSDKTHSRFGRRHPYMYVSFIVLPLTFYALFDPVIELNDGNVFIYILVLAVLIRTGTTLFEVPSIALLPELEKDYDRRNSWLSLRHAFGWYGGTGIHAVNFTFWVGAYGVAVQQGYSLYARYGALIIAAVILVSTLGTQRPAMAMSRPAERFRWSGILRELSQIRNSLNNRNFAAIFAYSLLTGVALGLSNALYLYSTTYFFEFTGGQIAFTAITAMIGPTIAYIVAPSLGRSLGKKKAAILANLANVALFPIPYLLVLTGIWPDLGGAWSLYVFTAFIVIEVACYVVGAIMLDSMMADVVEDSEVKTDRRSEGLFYAARGFAGKAISAGGIVGAGTIVTFAGLDAVTDISMVTDEVRTRLALYFLPVYAAFYLLAIATVSFYRIDREMHNHNLAALSQR